MRVEKQSVNRSVLLAALAALILACPARAAVKKGPLKIFLLAGQSNMEGHAELRTIDFLGEDPDKDRAALLKKFKPDGKTLVTRDDVWVVSNGAVFDKLQPGLGARGDSAKLGNQIGPEYAFGYFMAEALDQQVLLIKVAEGGTSLYENWRPPSTGPVPSVPAGMDPKNCGEMYRALVANTRETLRDLKKLFPDYDEKAGYEIAGFVWFQGFNDMQVWYDQGFTTTGRARKEYGTNLVCLIKDLRKELNAPNMKVVVGVMGLGGPRNEIGKQKEVRDGHRFVNTVPEFKGNVKAIETAPLLHPKILELNCAGSPPANVVRTLPNPPGNNPCPGQWLYPERDLEKNPITPEEQAMLNRATSNFGFHYFGEGRFFILLGKAFADTMQELMGVKK
jgi:alpha-galactosidase